MGLYDAVAPSERVADLQLVVNRIRRHTGMEIVPMLVVEGPSDEDLFETLCEFGARQVFAAGTRSLVEEMLVTLRNDPVEGCECVFLIDCDGRGKTISLVDADELIVTSTCDLEADLVDLGIVARLLQEYVQPERADSLVETAIAMSLPLSVVRRAAHRVSVSMKRADKQLRLIGLPEAVLTSWAKDSPAPLEASRTVAHELCWTAHHLDQVAEQIDSVPLDFKRTGLGKDALDALYWLLLREDSGDLKGWNCDHFHRSIRAAVKVTDLASWDVARRIEGWESASGHSLLVKP